MDKAEKFANENRAKTRQALIEKKRKNRDENEVLDFEVSPPTEKEEMLKLLSTLEKVLDLYTTDYKNVK